MSDKHKDLDSFSTAIKKATTKVRKGIDLILSVSRYVTYDIFDLMCKQYFNIHRACLLIKGKGRVNNDRKYRNVLKLLWFSSYNI